MGSGTCLTSAAYNRFLIACAPCQHTVQFYANEKSLLDTLEEYFLAGLNAGNGCVIIATADHRAALELRLIGRGVNLTAAKKNSSFIELDAAATLDTFMVDGWPDADRFEQEMHRVVALARGRGRDVRAYGEMVALLYRQGKTDAVNRLEYLWDNFVRAEGIALHCAYPENIFGSGPSMCFEKISAAHSSVIRA